VGRAFKVVSRGLTYKYWPSLKKLANEKHSSLFCSTISEEEKSFISFTPEVVKIIKLFSSLPSNELERLPLVNLFRQS